MMARERDWLVELRHSWPMLERPTGTGLSGIPLQFQIGSGDTRIAVDNAGTRRLLVPLVGVDSPRVDPVDSPVLVGAVAYRFGHEVERFAEVACSREDLFDLFDDVLVDVLQALEADANSPGTTVSEVVAQWRTLLAARSHRVLALKAQISLVAELYVLGLTAVGGAPVIINSWRGPLHEPQDVLLPTYALEVKAIGSTSDAIEIHGVEQLDPPAVPLALIVVEIEEVDDGRTLTQWIGGFLATVDDRAEALRRLSMVGYTPLDGDRYSQHLEVVAVRFVEVGGPFPRIVSSSFTAGAVPHGVASLSYSIELSVLSPLLIGSETLLRDWIGSHS